MPYACGRVCVCVCVCVCECYANWMKEWMYGCGWSMIVQCKGIPTDADLITRHRKTYLAINTSFGIRWYGVLALKMPFYRDHFTQYSISNIVQYLNISKQQVKVAPTLWSSNKTFSKRNKWMFVYSGYGLPIITQHIPFNPLRRAYFGRGAECEGAVRHRRMADASRP